VKSVIIPNAAWPKNAQLPDRPRKRVRIKRTNDIEVDYLREAREQIAMIKRYKERK
jgi:hypothetical protein